MDWVVLLVIQILFWLSVGAIIHTYGIFPVMMKWIAKRKSLPCVEEDLENLPDVFVLMAVYNEEAVLEETLRSIFATEYPKEKLQVYIGSDNSNDRSHEIIEKFQKENTNLHLRGFSGRNGKIRIINALAGDAKEQQPSWEESALILCDANVSWTPDLIGKFVRHFSRESVGLVASTVIDAKDEQGGIGAAEDAYVNGENLIKFAEGVMWENTMGAFGACYAMRANLFEPVPENYIVDDFFLTMNCLKQGKGAIVDLEAICYEAVSQDISEEFRRKKRISTGNFQNLAHFQSFLQPWNAGLATWFAFWSHKGLRWFGPVFLIVAMASSLVLAFSIPFYWLPVMGFAGSIGAALFDTLYDRTGFGFRMKLFRFVRYFYLMNTALFMGLVSYFQGVSSSVWEPTKRLSEPSEDGGAVAAKS